MNQFMPGPPSGADIDAMKKIMEAFSTANVPVMNERELIAAARTERTSTGTRVGSWKISIKEGARTTYDVVNVVTGEALAKDLYLYEACYGLVQRLNEGVSLTDRRIHELLTLEADYARNRDNAGHFKQRVKTAVRQGEREKAAIAEDRFDDAQRKAQEAREEILRLAGIRR